MQNVKAFKASDLFEVLSVSQKRSKLDIVPNGRTPIYSCETSNNGLLGMCNFQPEFEVSEKKPMYVIFGDHTRSMNIVNTDFCVADNVKVLVPKINTVEGLLYVFAVWYKAIPDRGYARHWKLAKDVDILLPVDISGEPDWKSMEQYIKDIEYVYVNNLKQIRKDKEIKYLHAANLIDYSLDAEDEAALAEIPVFDDFQIGEWFDKVTVKNKKGFNKAKDASTVPNEEFCVPLVNAKHGDNGIMFYGREEDCESEEGTICIVQNGAVATGDVYAEPQKTGVLWDAYLIKPIDHKATENELLYLAAALEKSIKQKFNYDHKAYWSMVQDEYVRLPIKDGEPDWDYMDRYITAQKKLAIQAVLNHQDKMIEKTEELVG